ncbi:MAG: flagellin B [Helicobacteraceae bacterium]
MSFIINTNISAMNASANTSFVTYELKNSLEKLSSGLRINKAADDSSGMAIADSLRSQSNTLGQAIRNANDAMGMIQVADKAMDEQLKILDTIKVKATQAAQDSQSASSRQAIQADIIRLIEQLDNIAIQTSYNGINMLAGSFTNKEFQVGAFSNETIKSSIGATTSNKIGSIRKETTKTLTAAEVVKLKFRNPTGGADIQLEGIRVSTSAGTGLGALAEAINKNSNELGVRAFATVISTGNTTVGTAAAGNATTTSIKDLVINGIKIGNIDNIKNNDENGSIVNSINKFTTQTGVQASMKNGILSLTSVDGRGIKITAAAGLSATGLGTSDKAIENYGRLTLTSLTSNDIVYSAGTTGRMKDIINSNGAQNTTNLRAVKGTFTSKEVLAAGGFANEAQSAAAAEAFGAGVTTRETAMMVMDIAQSAIELLDRIRADIGSVQQQLQVTKNNISVTQVNVKAAESGIRDVDFGSESSNFSKQNILTQSGSYALAQANAVQQNVMRLLQ